MYAYDGPKLVEGLLETFEDEAAEFAACGCALVAVRRVGDGSDVRKAAEYEERFPSINFVNGLDSDNLVNVRRGLGLEASWFDAERTLYYSPLILLLDPNGGMRTKLPAKGLSAQGLLGQVLRDLHLAVPAQASTISAAEAEANRQALYKENVVWQKVLEDDPSLRQPTRSWFDGLGAGRGAQRPLLAGVDAAALPEAIERYLADGDEEDDEQAEPLVSKDGIVAPAWYARAKRTAEKKQEEERLLWNGTAPSATPGPIPLGPAGRRLEPMKGYTQKALQEASAQQRSLVQAFWRQFGDDSFGILTGDAPPEGEATARSEGGSEATGESSPPAGTESALMRAEMLALGLSRSATNAQSTRRLRLVRELASAIKELEAGTFRDKPKLATLREQLRSSYASAPAEFVEEARRTDPFNAALPPLSLAEIAAEFLGLAESGAGKLRDAVPAPDFNSLDPARRRGPREKGNKIEIKRPADSD